MSKDIYDFISENIHRLKYDLEKGLVITPRNTNGTICKSTGYLRVKVNKKTLQVHQILAVIYFGEECIGLQVNHKDGNKLNNLKSNLEVLTQLENLKHAWDTGLNEESKENYKTGEKHHNSKLKEEDVRYIRNSNKSSKELSEILKTSVRNINYIRSGKGWSHVL